MEKSDPPRQNKIGSVLRAGFNQTYCSGVMLVFIYMIIAVLAKSATYVVTYVLCCIK